MESKRYSIKLRADRRLGLFALLILILLSVLGYRRSMDDNESLLLSLLGEKQRLELNSNGIYGVYEDENVQESAYVFTGEGMGYGGPLEVAVLVDTSVLIQKLIIITHNETPSYVSKVMGKAFPRQMIHMSYTDEFSLERDLDGVSGATYTSGAIAGAAKQACQKIAEQQKAYQIPESRSSTMKFGFPEILLILLFALSLYGVYSKVKWKKTLRWSIMIVSLIVLGFWLSVPLSILKINSFLLGYWPDWHTGIYWYLLIGGAILSLLVTNKTIYCTWICPFGTAQDCLGMIGKAKYNINGRGRDVFKWIQRTLAFVAIAAALYFRNPAKINFEIFGTFFNLTGSTILFVLTALYVLSSLFIKRPYCDTLCPIRPFEEFLLMMKKWILPKNIDAP